MTKVSVQRKGNILAPFSPEDLQAIKSFHENQILRATLTGCKKPRSIQQNRWIHAIFRLVAENTDDPDWDTPER